MEKEHFCHIPMTKFCGRGGLMHPIVCKSLKCNLTKFELFMSSCFQDIKLQNYQVSSYFSVAILPVLWQKITFEKLGYIYLKSSYITVLNPFEPTLTTTLLRNTL